MVAFGKLPFQFQQRGDILAQTIAKQDHKTLQQHLTKRDQDLENYLSTIKSSGSDLSTAIYTAPTVNGGSSDLLVPGINNPDWSLAYHDGHFDAGGVYHDPRPVIVMLETAITVNWSGATTDGFILMRFNGVIGTESHTMGIDHTDPLPSWQFIQTGAQVAPSIDGVPTDPTGSTPFECNVRNLGIAGLTGPDVLSMNGAVIYYYVATV